MDLTFCNNQRKTLNQRGGSDYAIRRILEDKQQP